MNEDTMNASVDSAVAALPPAETPQGLPRWKKIVAGIVGVLCVAGFIYTVGDFEVASRVDGEAIRYREISASMNEAADILRTRQPHVRYEMKKFMERENLASREASILRAHLASEGDTEHPAIENDEALSQWGREKGRVRRGKKWSVEVSKPRVE